MEIKEYVANEKLRIKEEVASLKVTPSFVIIQVNDDPASNAYVKGKIKDANEVGIKVELRKFSPTISEEELIYEVNKVNEDPSIHGLIVQMPLPKHINEERIKLSVSPNKDIDGFHPMSELSPCTPKGIIDYLKNEKFNFVGKNALIIGRSNIVGKPMAKLLLKEHCNTTIVHSRTSREDMEFYVAHADIIVIAIGKTAFLNNTFKYKESAVIVDVGINRTEEGLKGDAERNLPVALQTPVPGGVGLLTRLTLLKNLMDAYLAIMKK